MKEFRFWNYLFSIESLAYAMGIFFDYGRLIDASNWTGVLHIVVAIIFFFIIYRIRIKLSLKMVLLFVILAGIQAISIASMYDYFTPLPYLPWYLSLFPSYRLFKSIRNNKINHIESANENE